MNELDLLVENYFTESFETSDLLRLVEQVMEDTMTQTLQEKLNQGDVVEGIFAIAVALSLAYDNIDPAEVESLRRKIEPALYRKERQKFTIADLSSAETRDRIKVILEIRLKSPKTVSGAFGPEYNTAEDIPAIARKQASLIRQIDQSSALKKIRKFKDEILNNGRRDAVIFTVIADGLEGETSGGTMKGDVLVNIRASESAEGDLGDIVGDDSQEISFSLKSDSKTVANRGVLVGLSELADTWGLPVFKSNVKQYGEDIKVSGLNRELAARIFREFGDELMKIDMNQEFVDRAYDFIVKSTHGEDMVDIVDIGPSKIKEITKDRLKAIKDDDGKLEVVEGKQKNGDPIFYFLNVPKGRPRNPGKDRVFQLRTKLRDPKQKPDGSWSKPEYKMMVELGSLVFASPDKNQT